MACNAQRLVFNIHSNIGAPDFLQSNKN